MANRLNGKWYINDHCFFIDKKGVLHFFGINNPYPPKGKKLYRYHPFLGHAITTNPLTKWKRSSNAIDDSSGAESLGAPFVVWLKQQKRYVMLFESRIDDHRVLELAYSDDLYKWQRTGKPVLSHLAESKRDPFISQKEDGTFLIYLCTPNPKGSRITVTETRDFKTFENTRTCLSIDDGISWGGAESPLVVYRNGLYYLFFTYAHRHYYETIVCVSQKCDEFSMDAVVTTLYGHAAEILEYRGKTHLSSCGPEDKQWINRHGLYLAEPA